MRLPALLLVAVLALAGCGPEPSAGGSDPEATLAQLPGIRDAEVGNDDAADDPSRQYVVVDAEPDATADEVADAVRAVAELDPSRSVLYLGAGNTDLTQPLDAQVSQIEGTDDPDTSAAQLIAGAALDGVRVSVGGTVRVALSVDDGDAEAVGTVAGQVVADDVLGEAAPLAVTATEVGTGRATAVAILSSDQPLTDELVLAWTHVTDAAAGLTDPSAELYRPTLSGGSTVRYDALLGFADGVDPASLTPAAYPQVLALLHAALDTVRGAPAGSVVQLTRSTGDGVDDPLVVLTTGPDGPSVAPDPLGRGWGDAATAYLGDGRAG